MYVHMYTNTYVYLQLQPLIQEHNPALETRRASRYSFIHYF